MTRGDGDAVAETVGQVEGVSAVRVAATGNGVTEVDAVIDAQPGSDAASDTVLALRDAVAGTPEHATSGGTEAVALDASDARRRDLLGDLAGRSCCSCCSPWRAAALGRGAGRARGHRGRDLPRQPRASWWIFTNVLGFSALDDGVPLLAFVFLVALGVDYNIFLVTRAAEEARGHGADQGMLRALAATGGVITSAGILLAAVFAVLGVLPLVVLAQLGVVICVGVLLDTLVVRTVLVPALALAPRRPVLVAAHGGPDRRRRAPGGRRRHAGAGDPAGCAVTTVPSPTPGCIHRGTRTTRNG